MKHSFCRSLNSKHTKIHISKFFCQQLGFAPNFVSPKKEIIRRYLPFHPFLEGNRQMVNASKSNKACTHERLYGYKVKRRKGTGNTKSSNGISHFKKLLICLLWEGMEIRGQIVEDSSLLPPWASKSLNSVLAAVTSANWAIPKATQCYFFIMSFSFEIIGEIIPSSYSSF